MYTVLVGRLEGKRSLGRPRRRWGWENIKMDLQEVECGGYELDRVGSGHGQVVDTRKCGKEVSGSIKCEEFPE